MVNLDSSKELNSHKLLEHPLSLKPSLFNFEFKKADIVAIYNSISMKTAYFNQSTYKLYKKIKDFNVSKLVKSFQDNKKSEALLFINRLEKNGFLIDSDIKEEKLSDEIVKRQRIIDDQNLEIMYLLPTDQCNFRCKYCFVEGEFKGNHCRMSFETARRSIDFFIKNSHKDKDRAIIIYGGEPLLEKKTVECIIDYHKKKYKSEKIQFNLNTNGSLVDKKIAKYLSSNNVAVSVSLDGPKQINDIARISITGEGTFAQAKKSFHILKDEGCNVGISCTVGSHNVSSLRKNVEALANELDPKVIGFNILIDWSNGQNPLYVPIDEVIDNIIDSFSYLRRMGIYEERMMRRVKAFVEEKAFTKECPAMGDQIAVFPNGDVRICHAFINDKNSIIDNIHNTTLSLEKILKFHQIKTRIPLNRKECYKCPCLSTCGGGCPYEAYVVTGDINKMDERNCRANLKILEWMIWDAYREKTEFEI